jgi:hypothetical protein
VLGQALGNAPKRYVFGRRLIETLSSLALRSIVVTDVLNFAARDPGLLRRLSLQPLALRSAPMPGTRAHRLEWKQEFVRRPAGEVYFQAEGAGPMGGTGALKRPIVGNLSGGPAILSLKPNCLHWRLSAMRSPITSKTMRRVARCQSYHEGGRQLRRPLSF